jgi:hypothetical protein
MRIYFSIVLLFEGLQLGSLFRNRKTISIYKKLILIVLLAILLAPITQTTSSGTLTNVGATNTITIYPIADSYVDQYNPTSNYGGKDGLEVGRSTNMFHLEQKAYLMFDLSVIPSGSVITSAQLQLYPWYVTETQNIGAHYCSDNSWTETGITWNNRPSYSVTPTNVQTVAAQGTWYNWIVTNDVSNTYTSAQKKLTLVLVGEQLFDLAYVEFYSKDQSYSFMQQYSPKLVISITPPETNPPSVINLTPANGSFVNSQKPTISASYSDPSGIDTNSVKLYVGSIDETSSSVISSSGISYTPIYNQYGTTTIKLEVSDWAGNKAIKIWSFTVDTTPPTIWLTSPSDGVTVTTRLPTISGSFLDYDGGEVAIDTSSFILKVDSLPVTTTATSSGFSYVPSSPLSNGNHEVYVFIKDKAGNTASKTWSFVVQPYDTEPPVVSSISPSNGSTLSNPVTVNAHYSDNYAIRYYSLTIDGVVVTPSTVTASELEYTANYSEGPHTVQLSLTDTSGNVATATWSFTVQAPQPSRCFIATATYGSEAAPQVQFLRGFRDNIAMQTFAGSSFMNVFLGWYYSWSPPVAYSIAPDDSARAVTRVVLQPILNILQVATFTYSALSFNGEFAIVITGFVAAMLIGLVYFTPFVTLAFVGAKRFKGNLTLPSATKALRFVTIPWIASIALILIAELALAPVLMMIATAAFVILTIVLTVSTTSLWLASFYHRRQ